jgi:hypothetical protein
VSGGGFDVGECLIALLVCDSFDLVEASDGVADVGGIAERLFTFVGEGVDGGGKIIAFGCVERFVVFVRFPGRFHWLLQSS